MIKVKTVEIWVNFSVHDKAYAILRGEDGRYAFAWGSSYSYADTVPAKDVKDGESGLEWHETEDEARAAMQAAVEAWNTEV